jgi:hypothetical protein
MFVIAATLAATVAVLAVVVTTLVRGAGDAEGAVEVRPSAAAAPEASAAPLSEAAEAAAVLREWDDARAAAWATGDEAALRGLYAAGSDAGEQDVAMLRRWAGRGMRVEEMRTQLLAVDVVRRTDRRLVLLVTDRLADAVAVRISDGARWTLPRDRARTQRLTFRQTSEGWILASATPVSG